MFFLLVMSSLVGSYARADINCSNPPLIVLCGQDSKDCQTKNAASLTAYASECKASRIHSYYTKINSNSGACKDFLRVTIPVKGTVNSDKITVEKEFASPAKNGFCLTSPNRQELWSFNLKAEDYDAECLVRTFAGSNEQGDFINITDIESREKVSDEKSKCRKKYAEALADGGLSAKFVKIVPKNGERTVLSRVLTTVNLYARKFFGTQIQAYDKRGEAITCDRLSGWPKGVAFAAIGNEFTEKCLALKGTVGHCLPAGTYKNYPFSSEAEIKGHSEVCSASVSK